MQGRRQGGGPQEFKGFPGPAEIASWPFRLLDPSHCAHASLRNFKLRWQVDQARASPCTPVPYILGERSSMFPCPCCPGVVSAPCFPWEFLIGVLDFSFPPGRIAWHLQPYNS